MKKRTRFSVIENWLHVRPSFSLIYIKAKPQPSTQGVETLLERDRIIVVLDDGGGGVGGGVEPVSRQ
jgi:hypothetical protein